MYKSVLILLFVPVVVDSCVLDAHYLKDGQCCKMCGPGTRMKQNTDCKDPTCEQCGDLEYQDGYTKENKCKPQPICDTNLNFEKQNNSSKTAYSKCQCKPGHHCSSSVCDTCVKNAECKPGEQVSKNGTQSSDTKCVSCPSGTFSSTTAAFACQPWTECTYSWESVPGSSTSDRTCSVQINIIIVVVVCLVFVLALGVLFIFYKKGKKGSAYFSEKGNQCCELLGTSFNQQPVHVPLTPENELLTPEIEQIMTENELQPDESNEPQETEEPRPDSPLTPGISENGYPVIQDHSKSSIFSETETSPVSNLM